MACFFPQENSARVHVLTAPPVEYLRLIVSWMIKSNRIQ